ncbi:MAG: hypothetical protein ACFFBH_09825 [Promethearchaeota archaeon]
MGFGKAFGFSLLAYIGLNFLFVIITNTITGDLNNLFSSIGANPLILFIILLGPVTQTPTTVYSSIASEIGLGSLDAGTIVEYIGYIAAPLVAAIIAGKVGDNKAGSFLGWLITTIVMAIILIILMIVGLPIVGMTTFEILILAVINGIFYGTFALLFTSTEYY